MSIFLHILVNNISPIFILIGLGFIISKKFEINISTLSKLVLFVFAPGFMFYNLYTTDLSIDMLKAVFFSIVYLIANDVLARIIGKVRKYDQGLTNTLKNSIMFNNSGNIGLSLITLVFGSAPYVINGQTPYMNEALSTQIIMMVFTNIMLSTLGFYNAGRDKMNIKASIGKILATPTIYIIPLVLLLKYLHLDVTVTPLWPALIYIKGGLVPVALLALGVQLSQTKFDFRDINVNIAVASRLVIGPVLALAVIYLFDFSNVAAQTVFMSCAMPTAVNTSLIAVEYDNNKDFASQVVIASTIYSAMTLTLFVYIAGVLFPV